MKLSGKKLAEKLADELGVEVNRTLIIRYRKEGYTDEQIREKLLSSDKIDNDDDLLSLRKKKTSLEIEQKKLAIMKEQLVIDKIRGNLISLDDANEVIIHLSAIVKASVGSLVSKLPSQLEGLDAREMVKIIDNEVVALLKNISNEAKASLAKLEKTIDEQ